MSVNKYEVRILTSNSKVFFRNKLLRTPVTCSRVTEKELDLLKNQIKTNNLEYQVSYDQTPGNNQNFIYSEQTPIVINDEEEIVIEELYESEVDSLSTMDRLLKDDKE